MPALTTDTILILALLVLNAALILALFFKVGKPAATKADLEVINKDLVEELRTTRMELASSFAQSLKVFGDAQGSTQAHSAEVQSARIKELSEAVTQSLKTIDARIASNTLTSEQKLENIRATVSQSLANLQEDNAKKLEQMRQTVDEKLQKTLEERINQSFSLVNKQLEQVYSGLGEMKALASGVGDLKKVLSGVKTRGMLGEIQLGAILEQILSQGQYEKDVHTKAGGEKVEFAIKLPGSEENGHIWLPIDAKFPADAYSNLLDAYDTGEKEKVVQATKELVTRIKGFAKDIKTKYINVPYTTDFAIMFLPVEGLYAEVVRNGLVEILQAEYKINIAGPSTMAALLNSLQMGFRTLEIQKRSSEVWDILGAAKVEFDKFGDGLSLAQQRMTQASDELEKLVGVRTRQIQRRLKSVSGIVDTAAALQAPDEAQADAPQGSDDE